MYPIVYPNVMFDSDNSYNRISIVIVINQRQNFYRKK